jgi:hypothetical protein
MKGHSQQMPVDTSTVKHKYIIYLCAFLTTKLQVFEDEIVL